MHYMLVMINWINHRNTTASDDGWLYKSSFAKLTLMHKFEGKKSSKTII